MRVFFLIFIINSLIIQAQIVKDNFEGTETISSWYGDDCEMNTNYINPFQEPINTSSKVLRYE